MVARVIAISKSSAPKTLKTHTNGRAFVQSRKTRKTETKARSAATKSPKRPTRRTVGANPGKLHHA